MAKQFPLKIEAPLAGIRRDTSYQTQPPYSCIDILNFWPVDARDGRDVLATRPPLAPIATPDTPINLLSQLNLPAATLFHAANGKLYKLTDPDNETWSLISSTVGITAGRPVDAAPFFKRLLIANTGDALVYNDATGQLTTLASIVVTGAVPVNSRLAMTFAGAPWLGGPPDAPHTFACGRTGDITDWDSSQADDGGAFQSTGSSLGLITEPLTAMFAFAEDRAIIGCEEQTWVLTGHPRRGGQMQLVSNSTGVLGQWAWTGTPTGQVFFMSRDGLMQLDRTDFGTVVLSQVSKKKIPDELLGLPIDVFNPTVCVGYDSRWNGLIITVRGTRQQAWRYDLKNGGFTRMEFAAYPTVMKEFQPLVSPDTSGLMMGGDQLLRFDRTALETINTLAMVGPVEMSPTVNRSARIDEATILLGGGTNDPDAKVRFHTGPNGHVAALRAQSNSGSFKHEVTTGTLTANSRRCFPQLKGVGVVLTIEQTATNKRVVLDGAEFILSDGGRTNDVGLVPPVVDVPSTDINIQAI